MTTSDRPCHSKYQTKPEATLQLKSMGRQGISKKIYINNPIINTLAYEKTQVTTQKTQHKLITGEIQACKTQLTPQPSSS